MTTPSYSHGRPPLGYRLRYARPVGGGRPIVIGLETHYAGRRRRQRDLRFHRSGLFDP